MRRVRLADEGGSALVLEINTVPGQEFWKNMASIVTNSEATTDGVAVSPVQLLEETEYVYNVIGPGGPISIALEIFYPSDESGLHGRLRVGRATGTVIIPIRSDTEVIGTVRFDVRSRKLDYLTEYRWMLQRIADEAAEAMQSHFAASSFGGFQPSTVGSAETLYQRFAFVSAVLNSTEFQSALQLIVRRPHNEYVAVSEDIDPSRGLRSARSTARSLARPGPRHPLPAGTGLPLTSVPRRVQRTQHEESMDTVPNRFVRHALSTWSALAGDVVSASLRRTGPAAARGVVEATALQGRLDDVLRSPFFRGVGTLEAFPAQNTTLQGRAGYRDILRTYLQAEAAALVNWEGADDTFGAGQRDVAALYEYWVFLELARIVGSLDGFALDRRPLFRLDRDGLSLELRRDEEARLTGRGRRRGRDVLVELWFNRQFKEGESWSEELRPDCSLMITAVPARGVPVSKWLHFDAKYRVDTYRQLFGGVEVPAAQRVRGAVSQDLLKMHAYRDAIRRTTGAYVLYPGGDEPPVKHPMFHEVLPGLGAFVLRPSSDGAASPRASQALRQFLEDAIDHLAAEGTDEARSTFWTQLTYSERSGARREDIGWTAPPPADARVLLGFLRNAAHRSWVEEGHEYNMRADDRTGSVSLSSLELAATHVCLYEQSSDVLSIYEATGEFVVRSADALRAAGYPASPRGKLYCCLRLGEKLSVPAGWRASVVRDLARQGLPANEWGRPVALTLAEVLAAMVSS